MRRAAINASCGMLTLPYSRMRFFPSFCFSSSFRFRVASPPAARSPFPLAHFPTRLFSAPPWSMNSTEGPAAAASGTEIPAFAALAADPEIAPLLNFTPVARKVKRPDGWTPELQRELIARIAATGTLQSAVWQMGKHATGAEALYKTASAGSFRMSWDAALIIGRRRNGLDSAPPYTGVVPGIARRGQA